ncbi:MAG: hypothetical protein OXH84_07730 [Gammaproteobacteria bacterium]|nr:hypothetical protein [Gammaproteobacteria bacterium]
MKNLLILPLILLSVCVFADDRFIIGTIGQVTADFEDDEFGLALESNALGLGANFYNFRDESVYLGASFTRFTGDIDVCEVTFCISGDVNNTSFSGEIGLDFDYYTPFIGATFDTGEIEILGQSESDDEWSFNAGIWLTLDMVYLRGAVYSIDDSDSRSISGGFLYQMDSDFVFGAAAEFLLDSDSDGMSFTLSFGRAF